MACLLITPGEPAGIGPDVLLALAGKPRRSRWAVLADPELLRARAKQLGLAVSIERFDPAAPPAPPGVLEVHPVALRAPVVPGVLNVENAPYVLETLAQATDLMLAGAADALVTGPVHKGVIADSGIAFSGHTEFFAERSGVDGVLMVLVAGTLRVALVTTHLPLRAVPDAITPARLGAQLERFYGGLQQRYGIAEPHVVVLGLNPHAGEGGHLGREEIDVLEPVCAAYRARGWAVTGPVSADTAFTPSALRGVHGVLAMYHDQGLPVLKAQGFGEAINTTFGLPFIRTSVDHGTALTLAGTGQADAGSLAAAIAEAERMLAVRAS